MQDLREKFLLLEQTQLNAEQKWEALDMTLEEVKVIVFSETGGG